MTDHALTEAESQYLEAIAADCRLILGGGVELLDLTIDDRATPATIGATYRLDGWEGETAVSGETVIEAHAALREALVLDRLKLGFSVTTDPRRLGD